MNGLDNEDLAHAMLSWGDNTAPPEVWSVRRDQAFRLAGLADSLRETAARADQADSLRETAREARAIPAMRKHGHYHKDVSHLDSIDVYRVLELFGVTDQALGHAIKKVLVVGVRGVKSSDQDIQEAIDTLQRWQEMRLEDLRAA